VLTYLTLIISSFRFGGALGIKVCLLDTCRDSVFYRSQMTRCILHTQLPVRLRSPRSAGLPSLPEEAYMWVYDRGPREGTPDSSSAPDLLVFLPGLSVLVFQLRV
jgi:hypothetical protein